MWISTGWQPEFEKNERMLHSEFSSVSRMKENFTYGLTGRGWKPDYGMASEALRNRKGGETDRLYLQVGRQPFTLLPLLTQIVANTLQTLYQLKRQTEMMEDEMDGIKDKVFRIQTISEMVQPSSWDQWKDPREALNRLKIIYHTLPKEYRSAKADEIEDELSKAMNLVARLRPQAQTTFNSGKEMEQRGADASPGVAQKLTASGVGTLIAMEAQSQMIQSHITSLLAQMLADGNEKESRAVISKGKGFSNVSENLGTDDGRFSSHVLPLRMQQ